MSWQDPSSVQDFQPRTVPGMRASDLEAQIYYNNPQNMYPPGYYHNPPGVFANSEYYQPAVPVDRPQDLSPYMHYNFHDMNSRLNGPNSHYMPGMPIQTNLPPPVNENFHSGYQAASQYSEGNVRGNRGKNKNNFRGRGQGNRTFVNQGRGSYNSRHKHHSEYSYPFDKDYYPEDNPYQGNKYNGRGIDKDYYPEDNPYQGNKYNGRGRFKNTDFDQRHNELGNGDGNRPSSSGNFSSRGQVYHRGAFRGNSRTRSYDEAIANVENNFNTTHFGEKQLKSKSDFDKHNRGKNSTRLETRSRDTTVHEDNIADVSKASKRKGSNLSERDNPIVEQQNQEKVKNGPDSNALSYGQRDSGRKNVSNKSSHLYKSKNQCGSDESQRGSLTEQLSSNKYECMVCCDNVRVDAAIWSCQQCYHVFHLACIKKWVNTSLDKETKSWRCPGCQNISEYVPNQYRCFCGRRKDPPYIRGEIPHSCCEPCRKRKKGNCKHPCTILCHPGPCPPCSAMVWQTCDCGKDRKNLRCSVAKPFKCEKVCEKILNCGDHKCDQICHSGSCPPCTISKEQECFCKKASRKVVCGTEDFKMEMYCCEKPCERTLTCGNHVCEELCHPGDCSPCALMPDQLKNCCCGQTPISYLNTEERTSCLDPVPVCDKECKKPLSCGPKTLPHLCEKMCHVAECGPCEKETQLKCECGAIEKKMPCEVAMTFNSINPFKCQRRCGKKRTCGKHKCSDNCCVRDIHICEMVCGKGLSCGLHKCEELCHRGNCKRCLQASFEELTCHCGAEVLEPPVPCGTKLPECHRPCMRPHACSHPVRHNCHGEGVCPPCTELTDRMCMGGHMMRKNVPCHVLTISCGYPCAKVLPCGKHKCQKICHKGNCLEEGAACTQPCNKARPVCGHPCNAPCHTGECPDTQCKTEISITCPCGNRSAKVQCLVGGDHSAEIAQFQRLSVLCIAESGGQSGVDMSQYTQQKKNQRTLDCDTNCAIKERNRRMALALEIVNPDLEQKLGKPTFSDFLKDFAKKNPKLLAEVEKRLGDMVQSVKQSSQASRSYSFPPMNRDQRHFIHELAEAYGCQTQSYDYEPNKNVVATAYKDKCWLPNVTLTQAVTKEPVSKGAPPISSLKAQGVKFKVLDNKTPAATDSSSTKGAFAWGKKEPTQEKAATSSRHRGWEQAGAKQPTAPAIDYFDFTSD